MLDSVARALERGAASDSQTVHSSPGDIDLRGELRADEVCLLFSGWACAYIALPNGRRQVLGLFTAGDELSFYCRRSAAASTQISALTPVRWWRGETKVAPVSPRELIAARNSIEDRLIVNSVRLGRMTALQATCSLFVEVIEKAIAAGTYEGEMVKFPVAQKLISDMLGLSDVHMSRQLQALKALKVVYKSPGHLIVLNEKRLRAIAACEE